MAHEATHVAQQSTSELARSTIMRDVTDYLPDVSVDDLIPDWILDGVRSAVRAIPGYTLLTYVTGVDPLTGEPVAVDAARSSSRRCSPTARSAPPWAPCCRRSRSSATSSPYVSEGLAANDLTLARIGRDIAAAWDELSVTNGIEGNVAIVERLRQRFPARRPRLRRRDRRPASSSWSAPSSSTFAEPLLESPEIAPVWNLAKKVLHYDPLRGVEVDAPTVEIIADFLRLIGQEERLAQMQERGHAAGDRRLARHPVRDLPRPDRRARQRCSATPGRRSSRRTCRTCSRTSRRSRSARSASSSASPTSPRRSSSRSSSSSRTRCSAG